MVFNEKPQRFNPAFEIVSCFMEADGDILILRRRDDQPEGNTWCVPVKKVAPGDDHFKMVVSAIEEATGYHLFFTVPQEESTVYVRGEQDFVNHVFRADFPHNFTVNLDTDKYTEWRWIKPQDALKLNLIGGLAQSITMFFRL